MTAPVGVVGAGPFGRGLATAAARAGGEVILWSRSGRDEPATGITTTSDLADLAQAELIFVAVPSEHVRSLAYDLGRYLDGSHLLVHVSRGLVGDSLETLTRVLLESTPCRRVGALAGPLVARALAEGLPGGGVVGTRFPEVADAVTSAIAGPTLRVYSTDDVIGVEVASARVGILALANGYGEGLGMGAGTLSVMATRGMAEAARVGMALGGLEVTFFGLAGFGDLVAAMVGDDRPEVGLGRLLARGEPLKAACEQTGTHIEGVKIARRVAAYAEKTGVKAPIAGAVADVVDGRLSVEQAVEKLMTRKPIDERA